MNNYVDSIYNNPDDASLYIKLGNLLHKTRTWNNASYITLHDGTTVTENQLYIKAIDLKPNDKCLVDVYISLASNVFDHNEISLQELVGSTNIGTHIFTTEGFIPYCIYNALEHCRTNRDYARTYLALTNNFITISDIEFVTLRNGNKFNIIGCCKEAIRWDPTYAEAYFDLSKYIDDGKTVELYDGRICTKYDLLLETIKNDNSHVDAYLELVDLIDDDKIVVLHERKLNKFNLLEKVLCYDKTNWKANEYLEKYKIKSSNSLI